MNGRTRRWIKTLSIAVVVSVELHHRYRAENYNPQSIYIDLSENEVRRACYIKVWSWGNYLQPRSTANEKRNHKLCQR